MSDTFSLTQVIFIWVTFIKWKGPKQYLIILSTYSDSGQQPFRHVSHNDADEEDDSLQPGVTQDDGQDEECDAQEDGHTCDDMDKMLDLFGDGGLAGLQAGGQSSNATHDCAVSSADNDATCCAWFGKNNISTRPD